MVERGRKIKEEKTKKEGRQVSPPFFPVVFPAYDLTLSPSSERRALLSERLEHKINCTGKRECIYEEICASRKTVTACFIS